MTCLKFEGKPTMSWPWFITSILILAEISAYVDKMPDL